MNKTDNIYLSNVKDFLVSAEVFSLIYDRDREMLITSPMPEEEKLSSYYESDAYISHTDNKEGIMSFLYQKVKQWSLQKKTKHITNQNGGVGSLLDIGAGTGEFGKYAKNQGWEVYGVEPNENARNLSGKKGVSLKENIDDFYGEQFDVVTLWHVLEHLPNLEGSIKKIEELVKPGGVLIIAVPNFRSFDAKHYKSFWAAYDVPRHLWHFSRKSMELLFSEKMKLTKTKPMIFDSFYVSLLSEKYKSNISFSIKAICIGFWSNISAWFSKEYSSLIYSYKKIE